MNIFVLLVDLLTFAGASASVRHRSRQHVLLNPVPADQINIWAISSIGLVFILAPARRNMFL